MQTEMRQAQPRADRVPRPAPPHLPVRGRLAIATVVTVFNVWLGVAEMFQRRGDPMKHRVHVDAPREVLVSDTVKELVTGSDIACCERGEYELKGVPGLRRLFAAEL